MSHFGGTGSTVVMSRAAPAPGVAVHPPVDELREHRVLGEQLLAVGRRVVVIRPLHVEIRLQAVGEIFV